MAERPKRLYRSRTDRQLTGVLGGVSDYLRMDPSFVRIAYVILRVLNDCNRPQKGAKNQAVIYELAVLHPFRRQGFPIVRREVYGELAPQKPLSDATDYFA